MTVCLRATVAILNGNFFCQNNVLSINTYLQLEFGILYFCFMLSTMDNINSWLLCCWWSVLTGSKRSLLYSFTCHIRLQPSCIIGAGAHRHTQSRESNILTPWYAPSHPWRSVCCRCWHGRGRVRPLSSFCEQQAGWFTIMVTPMQ